MYTELRARLDYTRDDRELAFWRSTDGKEVDFILGDEIAIEVKATDRPEERDLKGLKAIAEEGSFRRRILACTVPRPSLAGGIEIMGIGHFLQELWAGHL